MKTGGRSTLKRMTSEEFPQVLVVDDDADIRELLTAYLGQNGFRVSTADGGLQMRAMLAASVPDVLVLDLMMPGEDGLALTRWVKTQWNLPILMLSARGEETDRVVGLEVGADDYLPKPFGPRELLARLRALLRRHAMAPSLPTKAVVPAGNLRAAGVPESVVFGPFRLSLLSRTLWRDGAEIDLTAAEYDLLAVLVQRPGRVLSRDVLITLLKGYDRDAFDRSIDNRVTRLRRKIETDPAAPRYIRTVRGEGYLFNPLGASG